MATKTTARPGASNRSVAGSVFEELKDLGKQTLSSGARSIAGMPFGSSNDPSEAGNPYDTLASSERMGFPGAQARKEKPKDVEVFSFAIYKENKETREQIEHLKDLIKKIGKEVAEIEKHNKGLLSNVKNITVEQMTDKPGIYHIRFFEWLLNMMTELRKKVSESSSWLSVARGKQKKGFWGMAKKKGTSFTLSGERTAATQSG